MCNNRKVWYFDLPIFPSFLCGKLPLSSPWQKKKKKKRMNPSSINMGVPLLGVWALRRGALAWGCSVGSGSSHKPSPSSSAPICVSLFFLFGFITHDCLACFLLLLLPIFILHSSFDCCCLLPGPPGCCFDGCCCCCCCCCCCPSSPSKSAVVPPPVATLVPAAAMSVEPSPDILTPPPPPPLPPPPPPPPVPE